MHSILLIFFNEEVKIEEKKIVHSLIFFYEEAVTGGVL